VEGAHQVDPAVKGDAVRSASRADHAARRLRFGNDEFQGEPVPRPGYA
jgi:hypothetical protein